LTNLTELRPRQVICIDQRRWSVELLIWERKSGLGLGQHQVSRNEDRIEKSFGMAIPAYLFLLRASSREIPLLEYLPTATQSQAPGDYPAG